MKKNNLLKTVLLFLFAVFLLHNCRSEENALEKSNPNTEYKIIHQNYSLVQKNNNLNQKFTVLENIANTNKKKSAKQNSENIIEIDGIKIFKDYVTYVSPINSSKETYSFYVENSNYRLAPNTVQNLVFSKKENETDYSAYLVTYTFPEGINNDNQNIKISKIEKLNISSFFSKKSNTVNTKLAAKTSSDCLISYTYDIIETKHVCSANKHYGDSEISECTADIKPYSTYVMKITSMYADCGTEGWGTPESGSSAPGGGSGSASGSTAPSVDTSISLPPTCQTGDCNEEILANKINTSLGMPLDYNELLWLNSNTDFADGIWNMLSNNSSTETKNFAQWGITFASNNNISWTQFQYIIYNKTSYETNLGDDDNNTIGGYDNTTYNTFNPQQQPWTTIQNVLTKAQFIGWGYPGVKRNCMDYCKAQIGIKGYQISNYSATGQTIQMYTAENGVNKSKVIDGLSYLKYALSKGIPVIVGVDDAPGNPGNADQTTDHFIVIVGMGTDSKGNYFSFFDNASGDANLGASPNNKLYYDFVTGLIQGTSDTPYASGLTYTLTQIRKSKLK